MERVHRVQLHVAVEPARLDGRDREQRDRGDDDEHDRFALAVAAAAAHVHAAAAVPTVAATTTADDRAVDAAPAAGVDLDVRHDDDLGALVDRRRGRDGLLADLLIDAHRLRALLRRERAEALQLGVADLVRVRDTAGRDERSGEDQRQRSHGGQRTLPGVEPVELSTVADDFDHEVVVTPGIDRFCSASAWILAAAAALMPPRVAFSFRGKTGYFAAMRGVHPAGFPYIEPVELAWGLASPLVGADPDALVAEVVPLLVARRDWQLAIFAGLSADGLLRSAKSARSASCRAGGSGGAARRRSATSRASPADSTASCRGGRASFASPCASRCARRPATA